MKHARIKQTPTRWLADILALGHRLRNLERESIAQETVQALSSSLGFERIVLYLVGADHSAPPQIAAQTEACSRSKNHLDAPVFESPPGAQPLDCCALIPAHGATDQLSEPAHPVAWHDQDLIYAPLLGDDGLLGYAILDHPHDGLRPTQDALRVTEILVGQAAMALQNAELFTRAEHALDERLAELATVQEIDRQINAKLDLDHVMDTTLDWAMHTTSAHAGTISLLQEREAPSAHESLLDLDVETALVDTSPECTHVQPQQVLEVVAHRGYSAVMAKYWDIPWPADQGLAGRVVQTGRTAVIEDVTRGSLLTYRKAPPCAHLATPIKRGDTVIGVISLESILPGGFTSEHLAFLMRLADRAAIAIENAQLYEQTNRRIAELESLQKTSLDLTSRLHLGAVLDSIVKHTLSLVQADRVTIYLYDEGQDKLSYGTGLSSAGTKEPCLASIKPDRLTVKVARAGKAAVVQNACRHMVPPSGHPLPTSQSDVTHSLGAIASIPLLKSERVLGVFDISYQNPHVFTKDELRLLRLLADQAAIAIENAQLYADAQRAKEIKDKFVKDVSRELKGPITSIHGYAKLMAIGAGGPITEQQRAFLDFIEENVRRMNKLVEELDGSLNHLLIRTDTVRVR